MDLSSVPMPPGSFAIGKTFDFEAAHRLPGLPPGHKCSRQHGHSYQVEVILAAPTLEPPGFVTDFANLAPFKHFLDGTLDHQNLNDVLPFEPTSERLAQFLGGWILHNMDPGVADRLVAVRVRETARSWARFNVGHP
jgi:6-pyruvoyltetrahydropterin/6-carboxytetrahydropterin synthase